MPVGRSRQHALKPSDVQPAALGACPLQPAACRAARRWGSPTGTALWAAQTGEKVPDEAVIASLVRYDAELALPTVKIAGIAFGIEKDPT